MIKTTHQPPQRFRRLGFTVIELLVVISLIAVLIGLMVYASSAFLSPAQGRATQSTIMKVDGLLQERYRAFDRAFQENRANRFKSQIAGAENSLPPGLPERRKIARALARKTLLKRFFPQSFAELGTSPPPGHDPATESSEVLYYLLSTREEALGFKPVGVGEFTAAEVKDTDGDGWPEFIDSWGNPLRFYRWPTRVIRPDGININKPLASLLMTDVGDADLPRDPHDPTNVLFYSLGAIGMTAQSFEYQYHTLITHNGSLIVSAGEDGELGLREPQDQVNLGDLARLSAAVETKLSNGVDPGDTELNDNITNRQTREDAK